MGSTDIITNVVGSVVAQMSFDAFGKRRNLLTLADLLEAEIGVLNELTTQGFTGTCSTCLCRATSLVIPNVIRIGS
ncbi:MAG: hypothetical protein Q8L60_00615 [Gammaproteobacteria bacterium]|nr:hypothetical protein [Gammaproteobacteria bacterium]MDP2346636.1 hypothetical protein [Gammaproteobacteria bacterium]